MQQLFSSRAPLVFACAAALTSAALAYSNGRPQYWAVKDVRLEAREDAPRKTLLLREGRIEEVVDADVKLPAAARVLEGHGMLALPAFVDAYSFAGSPPLKIDPAKDQPVNAGADLFVDMREANRKGIAPAHRVAEGFACDEETRKKWCSNGFSHLVSAPHGELLSGASALVCTRELASRDAIVRASLFDHAGFDASGPGYPGTLMGAMAQLRQFFLDARWISELEKRQQAGKAGERPPFDVDLEAILPALDHKRRIVCEAESAAEIERWIKLADEFSLDIAIAGGRDAWERAPLLAKRGIPVFLTLDWGDEPDDPHAKEAEKDKEKAGEKKPGDEKAEEKKGEEKKPDEKKPDEKPVEEPKPSEKEVSDKPVGETQAATGESSSGKRSSKKGRTPAVKSEWKYELPMRVREDRRRQWEERRDCAQKLAAAGVVFTFSTGKSTPRELLEHVRTMVEKGLPAEAARAALTTNAAKLIGLDGHLGALQPGFDANLALWSKDPLLDKEAKLGWLFVEGFVHEFDLESNELVGKPDEGVDASGEWEITIERPDAQPAQATLEMKPDGALKASLRFRYPGTDTERTAELTGKVAGKKLHLGGRLSVGTFEVEITLDGTLEGDSLKGDTKWKSTEREDTQKFHAARKPKPKQAESDDDDGARSNAKEEGR